MTIEQVEKMARGQAEMDQLRAELEAMTAVTNERMCLALPLIFRPRKMETNLIISRE
jgi:hypothetical protein